MIRALIGLVGSLLNVYKLLLVVYVVLQVMDIPANKWTEMLRSIIEPALVPVRRLMARYLPAKWQRFDWSPAALFILLTVVQWLL